MCLIMNQLKYFLSLKVLKVIFCFSTLLIGTWIYSQPVINSFFPMSGAVGTNVIINGSNFSPVASNNIVYFGATKALVTASTSTLLNVTVPTGGTFQFISVTTNSLTAYSQSPFDITFSGGGAITDYSFVDKFDKTVGESPYDISNADFDGDGKTDVVVVNGDLPYSISLFRNTSIGGAISFAPKIDYPTGTHPFSVAIGDIDGDGKKDIVVSNTFSFTISIFRNTSSIGLLSFDRTDIPAGQPFFLTIGDIDKDGRPDILALNPSSNSVSIFKNTSTVGVISFASSINYTTGNFPNSVAIADLDGDNNLDLAIVNELSNDISVFKNDGVLGSVSFTQIGRYNTGTAPGKIAFADINGDGKLDMNVTSGNSIAVYQNVSNIGNISFDSPISFLNSPLNGMEIADIDGDGKPDIAAVNGSYDSLLIIRNSSTPGIISFEPPAKMKTGGTPLNLTIADFDGDNLPDVISVNQKDGTISIIKNKVIGPNITDFTPKAAPSGATVTITGTNFIGTNLVSFGGTPQSFSILSPTTISVVLGSGTTGEIVVTTPLGTAKKNGFALIYFPAIHSFTPLNGSAGTIVSITGKGFDSAISVKFGETEAQSYRVLSDTSISATVAFGSSGNITVTTIIGNAKMGTFTFLAPSIPKITSFTPVSGPAGAIVNINGLNFDAIPENNIVYFGATKAIVVGASESSLAVVVPSGATYQPVTVTCNKLVAYSAKSFLLTFQSGPSFTAGSFTKKIDEYVVSTISKKMIGADLDGDGKIDFIHTNKFTNFLSAFLNTSSISNFSIGAENRLYTEEFPADVAVGDLDGDGMLDLVSANFLNISIFRNTSSKGLLSFEPKIDISSGDGSGNEIIIKDLDLDGKPDIIVAESSTNLILVFRNITSGNNIAFAPPIIYQAADGPISLSVDDLNNDDKPDIITANQNAHSFSIFRNLSVSGKIVFADKTDIQRNAYVTWICTGDLDNDGKKDIIITNGNPDTTISIYRNITSDSLIFFSDPINIKVSDRSAGIVSIGDLNGDGKPEIIAIDAYTHDIGVMRNNSTPGITSFSNMVRYNTGAYSPSSFFLGDIDGDGKTDMVGTVGFYAIFGNMTGLPKTDPSGSTPLNGKVVSHVSIDTVVNVYNGFPFVQRHYDIEPADNPTKATATVTLYFTQQDFNNYNTFPGHGADLPTSSTDIKNISNIRIMQFHGFSATGLPGSYTGTSVEINPADSNVTWNAIADCWKIKFDVSGFSGFFISSTSNIILPLTLVNFSGSISENTTKIYWTTTEEKNIDHYELQRSSDGYNFINVNDFNTIAGAGDHYYHYNDLLNTPGIYYYRLLIKNNNGKFTYSQILSVIFSSNSEKVIHISPNPSVDFITITLPKMGAGVKLKIINSQGQIVKVITLADNISQSLIDVKQLPAGLYTLLWSFKEKRQSLLFIKGK